MSTLFALILSLGLLVDDPITGVDNIERYLKKKSGSLQDKIVAAINEIRVPLLMSTLTIVLAFCSTCLYNWHDGTLHGSHGI